MCEKQRRLMKKKKKSNLFKKELFWDKLMKVSDVLATFAA